MNYLEDDLDDVAADFAVSWDGKESQNCGIFLGPLMPSQLVS